MGIRPEDVRLVHADGTSVLLELADAGIDDEGYHRWEDERIGQVVEQVLADRQGNPGGAIVPSRGTEGDTTGRTDDTGSETQR